MTYATIISATVGFGITITVGCGLPGILFLLLNYLAQLRPHISVIGIGHEPF